MRHRKIGRHFNRTSAHRKAMFQNMANSLFEHEVIKTTLPKAKELRRFAEPLITLAKNDSVANRRLAFDRTRSKAMVGPARIPLTSTARALRSARQRAWHFRVFASVVSRLAPGGCLPVVWGKSRGFLDISTCAFPLFLIPACVPTFPFQSGSAVRSLGPIRGPAACGRPHFLAVRRVLVVRLDGQAQQLPPRRRAQPRLPRPRARRVESAAQRAPQRLAHRQPPPLPPQRPPAPRPEDPRARRQPPQRVEQPARAQHHGEEAHGLPRQRALRPRLRADEGGERVGVLDHLVLQAAHAAPAAQREAELGEGRRVRAVEGRR